MIIIKIITAYLSCTFWLYYVTLCYVMLQHAVVVTTGTYRYFVPKTGFKLVITVTVTDCSPVPVTPDITVAVTDCSPVPVTPDITVTVTDCSPVESHTTLL